MRQDALLNLILTKQGGAHWGWEGQHSFDCSDHKMVKFRTLRAGGNVASSSSGIQNGFGLFEKCLKESCRIRSWVEEGPKKAR